MNMRRRSLSILSEHCKEWRGERWEKEGSGKVEGEKREGKGREKGGESCHYLVLVSYALGLRDTYFCQTR